MLEYDNVKEALEELYLLTQVSDLKIDGRLATVEDLQELYQERLYNVMDLLGHSDIYLN